MQEDDVNGELESNDESTNPTTDEEWMDEEDDDEEVIDNFAAYNGVFNFNLSLEGKKALDFKLKWGIRGTKGTDGD